MKAQDKNNKGDYSFWIKYKRFAGNELLLYAIMFFGILAGVLILSLVFDL